MKKTAFILSVILILLVAVMALIALFSEIEGDNVRHGIMGAGISTLPWLPTAYRWFGYVAAGISLQQH